MTPIQFIEWVIELLGGDLQNVLISLVSLAILLALIFMVRTLRLDRAYDRYEKQLSIIARYAPDVFLRLAFPEVDDLALSKELVRYGDIANAREASGLSWIDPRLLYAIDKIENYIPEGYRVDFNVVLDTMEVIYQQMKAQGFFDDRTDDELIQLDE